MCWCSVYNRTIQGHGPRQRIEDALDLGALAGGDDTMDQRADKVLAPLEGECVQALGKLGACGLDLGNGQLARHGRITPGLDGGLPVARLLAFGGQGVGLGGVGIGVQAPAQVQVQQAVLLLGNLRCRAVQPRHLRGGLDGLDTARGGQRLDLGKHGIRVE